MGSRNSSIYLHATRFLFLTRSLVSHTFAFLTIITTTTSSSTPQAPPTMDGIPHALSGSSHVQFPPPPPGVLMDLESRQAAPPRQEIVSAPAHIEEDDETGGASSSKASTPPPPAFALARVSKIIKVSCFACIRNNASGRQPSHSPGWLCPVYTCITKDKADSLSHVYACMCIRQAAI